MGMGPTPLLYRIPTEACDDRVWVGVTVGVFPAGWVQPAIISKKITAISAVAIIFIAFMRKLLAGHHKKVPDMAVYYL
jgi:hypothetical protein